MVMRFDTGNVATRNDERSFNEMIVVSKSIDGLDMCLMEST